MSCEYCRREHKPDPFFCIARLQEDHEQAMEEIKDLEKRLELAAYNLSEAERLMGE